MVYNYRVVDPVRTVQWEPHVHGLVVHSYSHQDNYGGQVYMCADPHRPGTAERMVPTDKGIGVRTGEEGWDVDTLFLTIEGRELPSEMCEICTGSLIRYLLGRW